ncbi:MAG: biotin/lipoyl-binding protein, partial [Bacillota bacterium]|nr:biotin/lipoyl-binding protein [Bacillota bacterium]
MKTKWKLIFGIFIVIAIAGAYWFQTNQGITVNYLEVRPGYIATTFKEEGTVIPKMQQPVYAGYNGRIVSLRTEDGKFVSKGQVLAVLDSQELDFQLRQLQAQLISIRGEEARSYQEPFQASIRSQELLVQQAQQNLDESEANLTRIESLLNAGIATKKEFDDAKSMLDRAKNNLELQQTTLALVFEAHSPVEGTEEFFAGRIAAIEAQVKLLQFQKNQHTIIAPASGIVSNLVVKEGEYVNAQIPMMNIFNQEN